MLRKPWGVSFPYMLPQAGGASRGGGSGSWRGIISWFEVGEWHGSVLKVLASGFYQIVSMVAPFLGEKWRWVDSNVCCRWNPVAPKAEIRKLWWRPKEQGVGGGVKKNFG